MVVLGRPAGVMPGASEGSEDAREGAVIGRASGAAWRTVVVEEAFRCFVNAF